MGLNYQFQVQKNVLIVRLAGELDHHESEMLIKSWKDMLYQHGVQHVIVNLEDVTFMDSSGLGVILGRYKEVLQLGGKMVVCALSPSIKRLFEMSGLFKIVQLEETEAFALESLGVAS